MNNVEVSKLEETVIGGDLSRLTATERIAYYKTVCDGLGLNPLTRPFEYLNLGGKLILYAGKRCAEQLRTLHKVSITSLDGVRHDDVFVVTAKAVDGTGRSDIATGAVSIGGLKGENLSNAMMKAETKAKNRATLSLVGLGMLDRSEIESIPNAKTVENMDLLEHLVPPVEPEETLEGPAIEPEGVLRPAGKVWDGPPEQVKKPPSKALQRDLNVDLERLIEWACASYPRVYQNDKDVKFALKKMGVTSWNATRDTESIKRQLATNAEFQQAPE